MAAILYMFLATSVCGLRQFNSGLRINCSWLSTVIVWRMEQPPSVGYCIHYMLARWSILMVFCFVICGTKYAKAVPELSVKPIFYYLYSMEELGTSSSVD